MPNRAVSPALSESAFDLSNALVPGEDENVDDSLNFLETASHQLGRGANDGGVSEDDDEAFIAAQQSASNRKTTKATGGKAAKKSGGGFQSMGLNTNLLKAITRKGFSVPTPIQRKTIPIILDNQDVVGMARTGSGKTAAFVIPMLEKLKMHSAQVGARAIILSPSRELALQTLKTTKEFGKGTDLRCVLVVGGDSLEEQFSQMTSNPDIIIATPGRFLHLLVEMSLDLSSIKYMVFDEADRLFEMGFASQLTEILHALPPARQTLLFSATLPASLVEFAKAGLRDPNLVRLDAESKISPDLESAFLTLKSADKEAALHHLLDDVIKMPQAASLSASRAKAANEATENGRKRKREASKVSNTDLPSVYSTIVFAATKHHVEYLSTLLRTAGFAVSYVYGALDQTARQEQVERFRAGETTILVVTDVAARGIDIPLLANVINYDFPSQPKIFVHRVGRTARAGRKGWSYSLVQDSDVPYLLDLQLFLGRKLIVGRNGGANASFSEDVVVGGIPRTMLDSSAETITKILEDDEDIAGLKIVATKGEKLYTRTRNSASVESARRGKTVSAKVDYLEHCLLYPDHSVNNVQAERDDMLARISGFRPQETVFEIGKRGEAARTEAGKAAESMRKRKQNGALKRSVTATLEGKQDESAPKAASKDAMEISDEDVEEAEELDTDPGEAEEDELEVTYPEDKPNLDGSILDSWQDAENFMSYEPTRTNATEERGYGVHSGTNQSKNSHFVTAARGATMDFTNDEAKAFAEPSRPNQMRWDKKSKKYVSKVNDQDGSRGARTIRGESGQKIAASFRSGKFEAWRKANKLDRMPRTGEREKESGRPAAVAGSKRFKHYAEKEAKRPDKYRDDYYKKKKKLDSAQGSIGGKPAGGGRAKSELKGAEDIRKARKLQERRRDKNARPSMGKGGGGRRK